MQPNSRPSKGYGKWPPLSSSREVSVLFPWKPSRGTNWCRRASLPLPGYLRLSSKTSWDASAGQSVTRARASAPISRLHDHCLVVVTTAMAVQRFPGELCRPQLPGTWPPSRVQELVPLLFPLQALHPLLMHLLGHLFVSLLFLLGGPLVLDPLHSLLRRG